MASTFFHRHRPDNELTPINSLKIPQNVRHIAAPHEASIDSVVTRINELSAATKPIFIGVTGDNQAIQDAFISKLVDKVGAPPPISDKDLEPVLTEISSAAIACAASIRPIFVVNISEPSVVRNDKDSRYSLIVELLPY